LQRSVVEVRAASPRLGLSPKEAAYAVILLAAVSLLWLFDLLIMASGDVARDEIPRMIAYCSAVIALQGALLFALRKWGALVFTVLAVVNTYCLYIVFEDQGSFLALNLALILLSLTALYFVLLQIVVFAPRLRPWVVAALCLAVAVTGLLGVRPLMRDHALADADSGLSDIRIVDFKRKPNIYFLGFDALMPQALTRKLLGIDRPPYIDVLAKHGGTIIPNLFADQVPTKPFWGRVMTIVPYSKGKPDHYVLGVRPAALLEILRHNGYETHFSYASGYFGTKNGPLLTTYAFNSAYSTCKFLHGIARRYGLLGYCGLHLAGWLGPTTTGAKAKARFFGNRLRIATRADKSKPQFFASHYPKPSHTAKGYMGTKEELDEYQKEYQERSVLAARVMDSMLKEIRSADPTAIVLVFGDHGPYTTPRGRYHDDPERVVQDQHGILGAVFGADECMKFMLPKAGTRSQTFAQVEVGLLQCLSGGTSPLRQDFDFGKIFKAPSLRFEDYVYE
jgi:hypothetical protein